MAFAKRHPTLEDWLAFVIALLSGISALLLQNERYAVYGALLAVIAKALPSLLGGKENGISETNE